LLLLLLLLLLLTIISKMMMILCLQSGLFFDSKVSTGTGIENKGMVPENGVIQAENQYFPTDQNGKPVWVELSR
jgi:hypothetical protein